MEGNMSDIPVSAVPSRPLQLQEPSSHQIVSLLVLPSEAVVREIGRAVILFAQLEHFLKVIYKRAIPGATLPEVLEERSGDSLGSLLNGVRDRGEAKNFDGLRLIAKRNDSRLASIRELLTQADALLKVRKKYVHHGLAGQANGNFCFLKSGEEVQESEIIAQLTSASHKRVVHCRLESPLTHRIDP
jgi:hypothetical protein